MPLVLKQGGVVARIYAVNTNDRDRTRMLLDPVVSVDGASGRMEQPAPVAQEEGGEVGADVDFSLANIAQTSVPVKAALIRVLEKYRHVFQANPKIVPACNRAKLQLPLTAIASPTRQNSDGIRRRKRS